MAVKVHITLPKQALKEGGTVLDLLVNSLASQCQLTNIKQDRVRFFGILTGDMPEHLVKDLHSLKDRGLIEAFQTDGKVSIAAQESEITDAIIRDLSSRSGLGDAWAEIDATLKDEIRATWLKLIESSGAQSFTDGLHDATVQLAAMRQGLLDMKPLLKTAQEGLSDLHRTAKALEAEAASARAELATLRAAIRQKVDDWRTSVAGSRACTARISDPMDREYHEGREDAVSDCADELLEL